MPCNSKRHHHELVDDMKLEHSLCSKVAETSNARYPETMRIKRATPTAWSVNASTLAAQRQVKGVLLREFDHGDVVDLSVVHHLAHRRPSICCLSIRTILLPGAAQYACRRGETVWSFALGSF